MIARVSRAGAVLALALVMAGCGSQARRAALGHVAVWRMAPSETGIPAPRSLCVSTNGELYVLDTVGRVLVYAPSGDLARQWSMPAVSVGRPEGIVELRDGSILIADTHYHRLVRFSAAGDMLSMWGGKGTGAGEFIYPVAVTQDPEGLIYVAEYGGNFGSRCTIHRQVGGTAMSKIMKAEVFNLRFVPCAPPLSFEITPSRFTGLGVNKYVVFANGSDFLKFFQLFDDLRNQGETPTLCILGPAQDRPF